MHRTTPECFFSKKVEKIKSALRLKHETVETIASITSGSDIGVKPIVIDFITAYRDLLIKYFDVCIKDMQYLSLYR